LRQDCDLFQSEDQTSKQLNSIPGAYTHHIDLVRVQADAKDNRTAMACKSLQVLKPSCAASSGDDQKTDCETKQTHP